MNRRTLLLGTMGGLGMRINKPSLVIPGHEHERHIRDALGMTAPRTIGQRQENLATDKIRGGNPLLVEGDWADGTAGQNLSNVLHELGITNNATEQGIPPFDPFGRETFRLKSQLASTSPSTTSTVTWSEIINLGIIIDAGGTWRVWVIAEASFTHSTGGIIELRLIDNVSGSLVTGTPTTQTTRERYSLYVVPLDYTAPLTIALAFEYRCQTAGTATSRAPWIMAFLERVL